MDIPLAVERLIPDAEFLRSGTYAELWNSWTDTRPIPSQVQLADAWVAILADREVEKDVENVTEIKRELARDKTERDKLTTDEKIELLFEVVVAEMKR